MNAALSSAVPNVVVVDPRFNAYKQLADSARLGRINLHFRSSGAEAIKLADRRTVDAWLIAADLDDMSGHDLVELLRDRASDARLAVVESGASSRQQVVAEQEASASGADSVLSHPITLRDLEEFLGMPAEERTKFLASSGVAKAFVTLPVGIGAAAVSIAVLLLS